MAYDEPNELLVVNVLKAKVSEEKRTQFPNNARTA